MAQRRRLGLPIDIGIAEHVYRLYHGDTLTVGRGEIWVRGCE